MSTNRRTRRSGQARPNRIGFGPAVEVFEKRELLTGISPFIQGTAFVDAANTKTLNNTDQTLPGVTINLYQGAAANVGPTTPVYETTTTDAFGNYSFASNPQKTGPLAAGTYTVVEATSSSYTSTSAQALSQIDQATVVSPNQIQVNLASETGVKAIFNGGVLYNSSLTNAGSNRAAISYSLNGVPQTDVFVGQLNFALSGDSNINTSPFLSLCIDPADDLAPAISSFSVVTDQASAINNGSAVGGQIGYLFNQYGTAVPATSSLPTKIQGFSTANIEAGLQVALWELEYPTSFTLNSPDATVSQFTNATDFAQIQTAAAAFIDDSAGKSQMVGILDASLTGALPTPAVDGSRGQTVLVGQSLNFGNSVNTQPATGTISGVDLLVSNTITSPGGASTATPNVPIAGTVVNLYTPGSTTPYATTTTNSSGAYSFTGVPVGTYTVSEVIPSGYNHLGQTTPSVTLSTNNLTATDNFFETASVSVQGSDFLVPGNTSLTTGTTGSAIAGTSLTLTGTDEFGASVSLKTTTAANGSYSFTGLNPTTSGYTVTETPPTTTTHLGQTSTLGTVSTSSPSVSSIILTTPGATSTDNFFEVANATISGTVYVDSNGNSKLDGSEPGIGGINVYLYNGTGTAVVAVTTTASNGTYSFGNVTPGSYILTMLAPSGYTGEVPTAGVSGGNTLFIPTSTLELIGSFTVGSGVSDSGNNFGQFIPSTVSGTVYVDANGNDKLDSGETGLGGITVTLLNSSGTVIGTTTSATNGTYSFTGIAPGIYSIQEGATPGYSRENANPGTSGGTPWVGAITGFSLTSGTNDTSNNFGQFIPSTVSGTVYVDANGNDKLDSGETGLGGITVTLLNSSGTVIGTTTSATNGTYSFTGIAPGIYSIQEGATPGYSRENANPGTSGGTPWVGAITGFSLTSGTNDTGNNFGQYLPGSISGTVYVDATGQGLTTSNLPAGPGDTGEAGVTITLTSSNGTKYTTTTDSNGNYSFNGVPVGTYGITETVPSGTYQTGPNALSYTVTTTVASPSSTGDNFSNYMACNMSGLSNVYYSVTTPAGATTWVGDLRGNTASGDTVTAYFTVSGSTPVMLSLVAYEAPTSYYSSSNAYQQVITSVATGTYTAGNYSLTVTEPNSFYQVDFVCGAALPQLEANGSPVDYNFEHRLISADNGGSQAYALSTLSGTVYVDANGNNSFGTGDSGLSGVPVTLTGTTLTGLAITPVTVNTSSTGAYSFGNLAPGIYTVSEAHPAGYTDEKANAGSVGGTAAVGVISTINLNSNTSATNYNFGELLPNASISGTVYADVNRNGTFGTGDTGLKGVTVYLYNSAGTVQLATTTTDANGNYKFSSLTPGTYIVTEGAPSGFTGEKPTVGTSGGTASFTSYAAISAIPLGSGVSDTGNNFGNLPATAASLCGIVYADLNCNNVYNTKIDYGISGVTVTLSGTTSYGAAYSLTTTTDCYGNYSFTNVVTGNYTITESQPSGYTPEPSNVGNAGGVIGLGSTSSVSLTSGAVDSGYNFGSKVNSCSLGNYQTCSTNYWCGNNGQNLINCMNGSSCSTKLGNWLSSMLPNICGSFAGKTNSQVGDCFQSLCWTNSCNANIVATALSAYCTNTSLAGCDTAKNYGFSLSNCGAGNCTVNVGNTFSGFGGPCGTTSLFQLLSFADSQSSSWSSWWGGWGTSQSSVSSCFSSINSCSKIG